MMGSGSVLCGQLLVVGLAGPRLAPDERRALERGERGGVVLFRRNVEEGMDAVRALAASVRDATPADLPPLIAVDQEGGRVARLRAPALELPPARRLGDLDDDAFVRRLAAAQGRELRALGFTMSFAPVADVHTRDDNPIIGDRAFGTSPAAVARHAAAFADGLADAGVLACAKHFPGHGDTSLDSHLALPFVDRARDELEDIELAPFRALAARVPAMMTAHVVYLGLDSQRPATTSPAVCTDLLRGTFGFEGVLFSDDLEMKAIRAPMGEAAVDAVLAGCDALLVCSSAELAERAHEALVREVETSPAFRARCEEALARVLAMRRRARPDPVADATSLARAFEASAPIAAELARRLGGASK